jgi:hypothetical protein
MTAHAQIINLNAQTIPQNPGRGTRMNPDIEDVLDEVKDKLIVLTDLFNFYETMDMHSLCVGFRHKTFNGLVRIIDECIDKLEALEKQK